MTAEADNDNGNGRVTMAVLATKLDRVIEDITDVKRDTKQMIVTITEHGQQIKDNCYEIERLRGSSNVKDWILAAMTVIAGAIGVNK